MWNKFLSHTRYRENLKRKSDDFKTRRCLCILYIGVSRYTTKEWVISGQTSPSSHTGLGGGGWSLEQPAETSCDAGSIEWGSDWSLRLWGGGLPTESNWRHQQPSFSSLSSLSLLSEIRKSVYINLQGNWMTFGRLYEFTLTIYSIYIVWNGRDNFSPSRYSIFFFGSNNVGASLHNPLFFRVFDAAAAKKKVLVKYFLILLLFLFFLQLMRWVPFFLGKLILLSQYSAGEQLYKRLLLFFKESTLFAFVMVE